MNNKLHLLESSNMQFSDAIAVEITDPQTALRCKIGGHLALASYYMANESDRYIPELSKLIALKLELISNYDKSAPPETQIEYVWLCLAIENFNSAHKFCSFQTEYKNSHKFDILLNCNLKKLLSIPLPVEEPNYKPTKTEVGLFSALDNILSGQEVDWDLLSKYWKATNSRRYQFTLFENMDLFTQALYFGQKKFNNRFIKS